MGWFQKESSNSLGTVASVAAGAVAAATLGWWTMGRTKKSEAEKATNGSERLAADQFRRRHRRRNRSAMKILIAWATTNVGVGLVGRRTTTGATCDFYEMTALWNGTSLLAGIWGYRKWRDRGLPPVEGQGTKEVIDEAEATERMLMASSLFDATSMATGAYLWEAGRSKNRERLQGYGPALVMQGAVSLGFDAVWLSLSRKHRREFEAKIERPRRESLPEATTAAR